MIKMIFTDMDTVRAFYKSDEYKHVIQPDDVKLGAVFR